MDSMKVAETSFEFNDSDWELAKEKATFSHRETCEFIFYLGGDDPDMQGIILTNLTNDGFSKEFLAECRQAIELGFKYICLYA